MRIDVTALVMGLLVTFAGGIAAVAAFAPLDLIALQAIVPTGLVVIGVIGLILSRRPASPENPIQERKH